MRDVVPSSAALSADVHTISDVPKRTAIALAAVVLAAVLALHLTLALVTGMLFYTLGVHLARWVELRLKLRYPPIWSVVILLALVMGIVSVAIERGAEAAGGSSAYESLLQQMAVALDQLRTTLPAWIAAHLPASLDALRTTAATWLREHAAQVQLWGQHTLRGATYVLIGAVIGAMAVVQTAGGPRLAPAPRTAWVNALHERFRLFQECFDAVVFAQVRIAAINTLFTGVYLLVVLPLIGAPLPLAATLVALTFAASLIPVAGNLISNTVIVVVSLTQGLWIATLSLGFLVAIHKFEYFLNAHIIGSRIQAKAFELLAVMLLFEALFGLAGVVMAPIVYAYAKAELKAAGWL